MLFAEYTGLFEQQLREQSIDGLLLIITNLIPCMREDGVHLWIWSYENGLPSPLCLLVVPSGYFRVTGITQCTLASATYCHRLSSFHPYYIFNSIRFDQCTLGTIFFHCAACTSYFSQECCEYQCYSGIIRYMFPCVLKRIDSCIEDCFCYNCWSPSAQMQSTLYQTIALDKVVSVCVYKDGTVLWHAVHTNVSFIWAFSMEQNDLPLVQ